jgi:hypothetical protein
MDDAIFAISPAGRSDARVTRVPSWTRSVTSATAASMVKASRAGRCDGAPGGKKWSNTKTAS